MKRLLFVIFCSLLLLGCVGSERLALSQALGAQTGAAANAITGTTDPETRNSELFSKSYWSSTAPFAIVAWKYNKNSLELMIQNKDAQKITLTEIKSQNRSIFSSNALFNPTEAKTITITMDSQCGSSGSSFSIEDIELTYTKGPISGLVQKGVKPIAGTCS